MPERCGNPGCFLPRYHLGVCTPEARWSSRNVSGSASKLEQYRQERFGAMGRAPRSPARAKAAATPPTTAPTMTTSPAAVRAPTSLAPTAPPSGALSKTTLVFLVLTVVNVMCGAAVPAACRAIASHGPHVGLASLRALALLSL